MCKSLQALEIMKITGGERQKRRADIHEWNPQKMRKEKNGGGSMGCDGRPGEETERRSRDEGPPLCKLPLSSLVVVSR